MDISIVIDLGFGDSGKGITVDYLARRCPADSLVVRFSGGHQVGHTVRVGDFTHTFSNFGAGTLRGVPTYYTPHTSVFPAAILAEYKCIERFDPRLVFHPLVMVTTPYDIAYNRASEAQKGHGSCGVGFGATIERNGQGVRLFTKDLANAWVFKQKLRAVKEYYTRRIGAESESRMADRFYREIEDFEESRFIEICNEASKLYKTALFHEVAGNHSHFIFEGSQGIMLDQEHGIFPHVTRSNTTSKNALALIRDHFPQHAGIDIYYVTRCYQSRHGNGPMSSEKPIHLSNHHTETNVENAFQGRFRVSELDVDLINYALQSDRAYHTHTALKHHLVVTCLDQRLDFDLPALLSKIDFEFASVYGSYSQKSEAFRLISKS